MLGHQGERAVGIGCSEGRLARDQLVEHDPGRVEVASPIDLAGCNLLGGHVLRRANRRPRLGRGSADSGVISQAGDAEVRHLDHALVRDEHVLGLHVAVDDGVAMGVVERLEHPVHHRENLRRRELARDHPIAERPTPDKFQDEVVDVAH